MAAATASQAWAILKRHARDEINHLRLHELCQDTDRVSSLVAVHTTDSSASARTANNNNNDENGRSSSSSNGSNRILIADLSRQRMTLDTLNHLLRLASARDVRGFIRTLAWGKNDRTNPTVAKVVAPPPPPPPPTPPPSGGRGRLTSSPTRDRSRAMSPFSAGRRSLGGSSSSSVRHQHQHRQQQQQQHADEPGAIVSDAKPQHQHQPQSSSLPKTISPSMHLAHRVPSNNNCSMLLPDGTNALDSIHTTWSRITRLSDSIRRGTVRGVTGAVMKDVVVVGKGVPVAALRFMYEALRRDGEAERAAADYLNGSGTNSSSARSSSSGGGGLISRRMRFVSSVDPVASASAVSDLNPATTIVVSVTVKGDEETAASTRTMKSWLLQGLGTNKRPDLVVSRHMLLVTGNERAIRNGVKPEGVFMIPEHSRCEAFTTLTVAGILPLSIVFGWKIVEKILAGAHDMDTHFVETNPRHNLPVLLALADIWNDAFLHCSAGRIVTPFTEALSSYPAFLAALESQTCGRGYSKSSSVGGSKDHRAGGSTADQNGVEKSERNPVMGNGPSAVTIDGGLNGNYDRALYQGGRVVPSELIMAMDTQAASTTTARMMGLEGMEEILSNHDALMCSFFAHADELAFGSGLDRDSTDSNGSTALTRNTSFGSAVSGVSGINASSRDGSTDMAQGNRPSTLLICGRCDAFACGQLLALSEHRAVVSARLWNVDPFARDVGSTLRSNRTERLKDRLQRMYERLAVNGSIDDDGENDVHGDGNQMNLATSTILGHYANRMRDQKTYVVKSP